MIPEHGWHDMPSAPKDGTIFLARSREWNNPNARLQVQPCQWLCDPTGAHWAWRSPGRQGTTVFADVWMTFMEFQKAQEGEGFSAKPSAYVEPYTGPTDGKFGPKETAKAAKPEPQFNRPAAPVAAPTMEYDL